MTCSFAKVNNNWLCHKKKFHINIYNSVKESTTFAVRDFPKIVKPTSIVCKECVMAKQKKIYFPRKKFTGTTKLEIDHTYLSDPTKTRGSMVKGIS